MAFDAQHGVNVAECLALADFLEALPPKQFDMKGYGADLLCGTVACVAGWQCIRQGHPVSAWPLPMGDFVEGIAGDSLGFSEHQRDQLFRPAGWTQGIFNNLKAAAVVRNLAIKGEVDWSVALEGGDNA